MSDNPSPAAEVPYPSAAAPPLEPQPPSATGGGGLLAVIERLATNPHLNLEVFDRLLKARHDEEDRAAKRAYLDAKAKGEGRAAADHQGRHLVDYAHKDGRGRTKYKYEDLFDITQIVDPILAKHGLSYSHRVTQNGNKITVTCIFSHADGYSEEFPQDGVEDNSGQKSANQAVTSTITFMRIAPRSSRRWACRRGRDNDGSERNRRRGSPPSRRTNCAPSSSRLAAAPRRCSSSSASMRSRT